jgi:hypothetical protein
MAEGARMFSRIQTFLCIGILTATHLASAQSQAVATKSAMTTEPEAVSAPGSSGITRANPHEEAAPADLCASKIASIPTRPNWDTSAQTTQCGVTEVDSGWLVQPMGGGVNQTQMLSSLRYGVTPKLDLRLGLTAHVAQSGGGTQTVGGIGDQWVMVRYRFLEQSAKLPAVAFLYGVKAPAANPAKGFGSGYVDHQFTLIASRDFGKSHFDFDAVGTVVGEQGGHDGAAQFGLALTQTVTQKLSWILEGYGGPQPGTPDRFGAGFTGLSYTVRPTLVLDVAYSQTYTAGSPCAQYMFGFTYAMPLKMVLPGVTSGVLGRLLGR